MILSIRHWSIAVLLALTAGFALWFGRLEGRVREEPPVEAQDAVVARPPEPTAFLTSPTTLPEPSPTLESTEVEDFSPPDPEEYGGHPHPITSEHERIFAENRTIGALNDAMAQRDVKQMRDLLDEYRKLDPNDIEASQAGYEIIADCIEFPGGRSLEAARHFYDTERHSPLRRFVRRICFANAD